MVLGSSLVAGTVARRVEVSLRLGCFRLYGRRTARAGKSRLAVAKAGYYGRAAVVSGPGTWIAGKEEVLPPEAVASWWKEIVTLEGAQEYTNANAALMDMLTPPRPQEMGQGDKETRGQGDTVQGVFDRMGEFFQADAAAGVDVVFQFNISGPGGGWHVTVKESTCTVEAGVHPKPTTTLKMSDEDFLKYASGQLPAMQAFTTGRLKIGGDLMKSQ